MNVDRRTALRLAGLGLGTAVAGCVDTGGEGEGTPTETPDGTTTGTPGDSPTETPGDADVSVAGHASMQFALRSSSPEWYREGGDDPVGHAIVVDSESRQDELLALYDLPEERETEVRGFLADVDYETDRIVVVESVGPNGCHDEVAVGDDVRVEDGHLQAAAGVVDSSEEGAACTEALVYPSALLRITFDGEPVDEVAVEVTDGWEETDTVMASASDPLPSSDSDEQSSYVRPDSDPDPVAPLECDESGVRRHDQWYDEETVRWGDFEADSDVALSLRVDALEYAYGETATVTLTNVADESVETGNRAKYNFQVYTEDGWQDVRVKDEDGNFAYTDEAVEHAPGEGFEWSVELTEAGIVEGTFHDDARVCPDLQPGRYRFAYFGVIGDGAVAVSFDLS